MNLKNCSNVVLEKKKHLTLLGAIIDSKEQNGICTISGSLDYAAAQVS